MGKVISLQDYRAAKAKAGMYLANPELASRTVLEHLLGEMMRRFSKKRVDFGRYVAVRTDDGSIYIVPKVRRNTREVLDWQACMDKEGA